MNAVGKSDGFVVPTTRVNNAATAAAKSVEGRRPPKGSMTELPPMFRTPRRAQHQLEWHGRHDWCPCIALGSFDPMEEPYEVVPHVRICAGGRRQRRSLPRFQFINNCTLPRCFRIVMSRLGHCSRRKRSWSAAATKPATWSKSRFRSGEILRVPLTVQAVSIYGVRL